MDRLYVFCCPVCGNVTLSYGRPSVKCCGEELLPMAAAPLAVRPAVSEMDGEFLLMFDCPMSKADYIAAVVVERYDAVSLFRLFAEGPAQVRVPQLRGSRVYVVRRREGAAELSMAAL